MNEPAGPGRPPGKKQPSLFEGAAEVKDFLAPSLVREAAPGEKGAEGAVTDYWVEVGETAEPVRYYRSFYAAITGGSTWVGMLDALYLGDFGEGDCDTAIHVRPADSARALWEISRRIAGIESDLATEANTTKRSSMLQALSDLHEQHRRLRTGTERLFYVTVQVVASGLGRDTVRRYWNALVRRLAGQGVVLRAADTMQLPALLAASPLGNAHTFRKLFRSMETSNVADLFPFGLGGISHRSGIVLGEDDQGRLVFFDGWHPGLENYNLVIFGRSGAGKSVAIKAITVRSALAGVHTVVIDWENEYKVVVEAAGCPYIGIGPNSEHRLNIFDVDVEEDDEGNRFVAIEESVKAVEAVVLRMLLAMDPAVITGQVRVKLGRAVRECYRLCGITEDPESLFQPAAGFELGHRRKDMPTLSDLVGLLSAEPDMQDVVAILRTFTREGGSRSQAVFDGQSTVEIGEVPIVGFSLADLDEEVMRPIGTFVVTKWVWERFGKKNPRQRKRILIDEAQIMMAEHETAVWLENAFRRARKLNVSMCAVTQGFEVFLRVPEGMGILKNAPTKILLRQEPVDIDAVRGKFALSEGEAAYLLTVDKGWGLVRVREEASRIYFRLTPDEYALFTTDPNDPKGVRKVG